MAWYTVSHICGHTDRHQIYGPIPKRQPRADWLAEHDCPACYAAKKEADRQAENDAAAQKTSHLPALKGSEKQVAWATSIRAKACTALGATDLTEIERRALAAYYDATTDARYWINRRRIKDDSYLWRQELQKWAGEAGLMPKQEWRKII